MKFTITREQLQEGLSGVAAAIPAKTTLPVLANVLVEVTKQGLRLSGTDLDIAVTTTVPAEVDAEGAVTLPAKKLVDIARELPSGPAGSSRAMSTSFFAGRVTAPSASTSAGTVVVTAMSRSVPERRRPCLVTSTRTLASTGRVVLAGIAAATPPSPSCSCSRVIVNFIRPQPSPILWTKNLLLYYDRTTSS